jgi:hypothetical protein
MGMEVAAINAGTIKKTAADAEEPRQCAHAQAEGYQTRRQTAGGRAREANVRNIGPLGRAQHDQTDDDHHDAEQRQQTMAVNQLGD